MKTESIRLTGLAGIHGQRTHEKHGKQLPVKPQPESLQSWQKKIECSMQECARSRLAVQEGDGGGAVRGQAEDRSPISISTPRQERSVSS